MGIALTVPQRTERVVASDLEIRILGECRYPSPLAQRLSHGVMHYVGNADHVLLDDRVSALEARRRLAEAPSFELTGPRNRMLETNPTLSRSLRARLPYIDPLNHLQVELLRRHRSGEAGDRARRGIHLTINGIAAGLRNSG